MVADSSPHVVVEERPERGVSNGGTGEGPHRERGQEVAAGLAREPFVAQRQQEAPCRRAAQPRAMRHAGERRSEGRIEKSAEHGEPTTERAAALPFVDIR